MHRITLDDKFNILPKSMTYMPSLGSSFWETDKKWPLKCYIDPKLTIGARKTC